MTPSSGGLSYGGKVGLGVGIGLGLAFLLLESPLFSFLRGRRASPDDHVNNIDTLPPEIRRHLLSRLDLEQLSALVHASPVYYQQYLLDRKCFLCTSLERTLGSAANDALAAHRFDANGHELIRDEKEIAARRFSIHRNQTRRDISGFLKDHYSNDSSRPLLSLNDKLSLEEAISMTAFHSRVVRPLRGRFASWLLEGLAHEVEADHVKTRAITRTEMMRLTRATYRFQLLCQVTDDSWERRIRWDMRPPRESNVLDLFDFLDAWEIEELLSFSNFAQEVFDKVLNDVYWDLHEDNPRFDDQRRPPTPKGAFRLDVDHPGRNSYLEGLTLGGLPLLRTVLIDIEDHDSLVSTITDNMKRSYIPFVEDLGILGDTSQSTRREYNPTERDRWEEDRVEFLFRGDGESDAPPLAWTKMWRGTYSNLYGELIPREIRRWGYVFWDAATLEATGASEVLERQLWDDEDDPRDWL